MASGDKKRIGCFRELRDLNLPWRNALEHATRRFWPAGYQVPGGKDLFFMENGLVRLVQRNLEGQEKIVWYIGQGCIFGESPLFNVSTAVANFVTATDCDVYIFPGRNLDVFLRNYPDLMLNLVHSMAYKIRVLAYQASSLTLDNVLVRLCKYLAERIQPGSAPPVADIGVSRQDLANLLGVNRVTLYKILKEQEAAGLFGPVKSRKIAILKPSLFFEIINQ